MTQARQRHASTLPVPRNAAHHQHTARHAHGSPAGHHRRRLAGRQVTRCLRLVARGHRDPVLAAATPCPHDHNDRSSACSSAAAMRNSRSVQRTSTGQARRSPSTTTTCSAAHHEPPPAAPRRQLRRGIHGVQERCRGRHYTYSLLVGMSVSDVSGKAIANLGVESQRHVGRPDVSRGHDLRPERGPGQVRVEVEGRPGRGAGRDDGLQPVRHAGVRVPAQGDGAEAFLHRRTRRRAARPRGPK